MRQNYRLPDESKCVTILKIIYLFRLFFIAPLAKSRRCRSLVLSLNPNSFDCRQFRINSTDTNYVPRRFTTTCMLAMLRLCKNFTEINELVNIQIQICCITSCMLQVYSKQFITVQNSNITKCKRASRSSQLIVRGIRMCLNLFPKVIIEIRQCISQQYF